MSTQQTLADLVAIDSVSSRSNAEIISYLAHRCEALGLVLNRFPHIDENGNEKINLVAVTSVSTNILPSPLAGRGGGGVETRNVLTPDPSPHAERGTPTNEVWAIELALVGHTDTVPYDANWKEALTLTERDSKLFGRGACDTKAFIAAALTAVENVDLKKLTKPLALVFTSDEEIGCLGAKRLADAKPFAVKYAIVGEPTSLKPRRAGKGYCLAHVTLRGREAHSAYPQIGASAIFRAARLIERIEALAEGLKKDQHQDFDPPFTTINIGLINGGTAKNIIPGDCRFTLEWRTIPGQKAGYVLDLVRSAITNLKRDDPDFECEIEADRADDSFETRRDSELVEFLEQAANQSSGTVAFGTEAPSMMALGAEAVVFGPGDIRVAHRTAEFVPIDQLQLSVQILQQAIQKFCI
jgi:acetylornithine deacetylase